MHLEVAEQDLKVSKTSEVCIGLLNVYSIAFRPLVAAIAACYVMLDPYVSILASRRRGVNASIPMGWPAKFCKGLAGG